ncbi:LysR family transcriptional regulator [Streptomyces sp. NPDC020412]|uniref:LysR family transcriptional regulator n=1 Tax=Streptomyces sp. NPDC020412 TaxID=3365073 RepID=UPI003796E38F
MSGLETHELRCFIVLSEELHFGRTGRRLYITQSRVSQLLAALERRIGVRLVERTSRRVSLTPFGERFLTELRPAYEHLESVVEAAREAARDAARDRTGTLRIGFQCAADGELTRAVAAFREAWPQTETQVTEVPLADPFGALRRGEVDAAVVLLPVEEPDLEVGPAFAAQQQSLAMCSAHPYSSLPSLPAAALPTARLISPAAPAPAYWRAARAPGGGDGPVASTVQEGLTLVGAGVGTMLLCRASAERYARDGVTFVPVDGLPPSSLALVWRRGASTPLIEAFATALTAPTRNLAAV